MKHYITLALAVLALAACNKNAEPADLDYGRVQIDPVITRATEVNFETGDRIGLTITTDDEVYAENALMAYAGGAFAGDLVWYTEQLEESKFTAYYPYQQDGVPTVFSPAADQTSGLGTSDFMAAVKEGVLPSYNAVSMVFRHMMTKIVVNIENKSDAPVSDVELSGVAASVAVDLDALTVQPLENAEKVAVKAYEVEAGKTYHAIIVPQTAALEVSVKVGSGKVTRKLVEMTMKQGGQYSVNIEIVGDDVYVSASGEIENWTDEGEIEVEGSLPGEDAPADDNYIEYGGVRYKTVVLADGNTWMAENLRYIPEGKTVSSNPAEDAGIWYPAANAEKTADPELVETLGLLYDAATAFGAEITVENAASFEGCRGICPEGWHIPTLAEMTGLVGHCSNGEMINPDGAYYDSGIGGASLEVLAEAGWAWQFASFRNKANTAGKGSYTVTNYNGVYGVMSYLIGSSNYQVTTNDDGSLKNVQYYYLMPTYNASNEKVTVAYGNFLGGASLRCVKDK